jgi:hypothetical protein
LGQNLAYAKYQHRLPTTSSSYEAFGVLDFNARIVVQTFEWSIADEPLRSSSSFARCFLKHFGFWILTRDPDPALPQPSRLLCTLPVGVIPPERPIDKHLEILTPWIYFGELSVVFGPLGASWRFGLGQNLAYTKDQHRLPTTSSSYEGFGVLDFNARIVVQTFEWSIADEPLSTSSSSFARCFMKHFGFWIFTHRP